MKKIIVLLMLLCHFGLEAQISIAEARTMLDGQVVTIEGIILNGGNTSELRFIQDETAAIALFDGFSDSEKVQFLEAGDRVQIQGEIGEYQGLLELNKILDITYISPNNPLPEPKLITLDELGESNESQYVKLKCATLSTSSTSFSSIEYEMYDAAGSSPSILFIDDDSDALGKDIPEASFELTGISYQANNRGILLREYDEIVETECLSFSKLPKPTQINKQSVAFNWSSTFDVSHHVFLGTTPEELSLTEIIPSGSDIDFTMPNLLPGSIYFGQVLLIDGQDSLYSVIFPFVTQSNSSGEIEVFFNNDVDDSFSDGSSPISTESSDFDKRLFDLLDEAESTIDIAMYNINRTIIVNYLIDAHNRGVRIRYIADDETNNSAFDNVNPPFGLVYGNPGNSLMHNKFIIIDAGLEDKSRLIMGSMNFTNFQMSSDPNHMLVIHDQSLAKVYTMEFEEMWGSDTEFPNISNARFGENKLDNTPHYLNINGIPVESYFSPSDKVTSVIENELNNISASANIGLLTMTKNELGTAVVEQKNEGDNIRVILENFDDNGSEYNFLVSSGVPVKTHPSSRIFHHKYAILDEGEPDARVLTGSHNWTNKAEFQNDENTLIIRDQSITNIFRQEFEARWSELPSSLDEISVNVKLFPNPTDGLFTIEGVEGDFDYKVYDVTGNLLFSGDSQAVDIQFLNAGCYLLKLNANDRESIHKIIKQ